MLSEPPVSGRALLAQRGCSAGIRSIPLAAHEKPRPQDVFVHTELGKARGGTRERKGAELLSPLSSLFSTLFFFFFLPKS